MFTNGYKYQGRLKILEVYQTKSVPSKKTYKNVKHTSSFVPRANKEHVPILEVCSKRKHTSHLEKPKPTNVFGEVTGDSEEYFYSWRSYAYPLTNRSAANSWKLECLFSKRKAETTV